MSFPTTLTIALQNRLPQTFLRQVAFRTEGWILTHHHYSLERSPPIHKSYKKYSKLMLHKPWICLSATIRLDEPRCETELRITGDTFHFEEFANDNSCYLLTLKDTDSNKVTRWNSFSHVTTDPILGNIWDTLIQLSHSPKDS